MIERWPPARFDPSTRVAMFAQILVLAREPEKQVLAAAVPYFEPPLGRLTETCAWTQGNEPAPVVVYAVRSAARVLRRGRRPARRPQGRAGGYWTPSDSAERLLSIRRSVT